MGADAEDAEDAVAERAAAEPGSAFAVALESVRAGVAPLDAAGAVVAAMTPVERLWCLDGDSPAWDGVRDLARGSYHRAPFEAAVVERVGMPGIAFADGPRGAVIGNATCFPVAMARGATWDPDLEERVGDVIGRELRAQGASLFGGVCVNLLRHPGWGRAQETYGEDPFHVGELGAAVTRGVQRHVMACVKHLAANSIEESRFRVDVRIDERALDDVHLPAFRRVVDEGVASVMTAYNAVNGTMCGDHAGLVRDTLRGRWGFEGFVISDFIFGLRSAVASLEAGLDLEMPSRMVRARDLPGALDRGEVSWDLVDAAVARVVSTLLRFDDVLSAAPPSIEVVGSDAHRRLAREVAGRSVVLLRNEPVGGVPVLPIDAAAVRRVAVVGRLADRVNLGDGGSSDVWSLDDVTVLDGLRAALSDAGITVEHVAGDDLDAAAALAGGADVTVVVVGLTLDDEGEFIGDAGVDLMHLYPEADDPDEVARHRERREGWLDPVRPPRLAARRSGTGFAVGGDRRTLALHPHDEALVRAVAAASARVVVLLQGGSAITTSAWEASVAAVAHTFYAGCEGGHGVADVLLGRVDASGRLPFTVPVDEGDLPPFDPDADEVVYDGWHGWWRAERDGWAVAHPFGSGLSYTSFALRSAVLIPGGSAEPVVGPDAGSGGHDPVVEVQVANTGSRPGSDVVQLYARGGWRPRLVGFARVEVAAGEEAVARIVLPVEVAAEVGAGSLDLAAARHAGDPDAVPVAVVAVAPDTDP